MTTTAQPKDPKRDTVAAVGVHVDRTVRPAADARCCWNCKHWHVRECIHCQCSGPWGGDIQGDPRCTFELATRSQMLTRHGFKRRPTWRSLPSDE